MAAYWLLRQGRPAACGPFKQKFAVRSVNHAAASMRGSPGPSR
jgi:hypothetical protein